MEFVNHPAHYNITGKKECIEQMREDYGDYITAIFCLTNIYKYMYRAGHKTRTDDFAKSRWYWDYVNTELDCKDFFCDDLTFANLYSEVERMMEERL